MWGGKNEADSQHPQTQWLVTLFHLHYFQFDLTFNAIVLDFFSAGHSAPSLNLSAGSQVKKAHVSHGVGGSDLN